MHVGAPHGSLKFAIKEDLVRQESTANSVPGTFRQTAEYFDANPSHYNADRGRKYQTCSKKGCSHNSRRDFVAERPLSHRSSPTVSDCVQRAETASDINRTNLYQWRRC